MISFFQSKIKKQIASLRAYQKTLENNREKKISWSILQKGSMTVEAALIMPVFLFAILNMLSIADIIRVHSNIQAAMTETVKEMAVYGYAYDKWTDGEENNLLCSLLAKEAAKNSVKEIAGREYLDRSVIKDGSEGLWFITTDIMYQGDMIDLIARYRVTPLFKIAAWNDIFMINRCRMHAWTGFDVVHKIRPDEGDERIVYVSEYGEVYHTTRACSHLKLSISTTDQQKLEAQRNLNGEKYKKCDKCVKNNKPDVLYITDMGNRYHATLSCSGLKRTIKEVPLSNVKLPPCKNCG